MVPPAPVRFSITTGCPQFSLIFWEIMRARTSDVPPGENGTTKRIGLLGKFCCACAGPGAGAMAIPIAHDGAEHNSLQSWHGASFAVERSGGSESK